MQDFMLFKSCVQFLSTQMISMYFKQTIAFQSLIGKATHICFSFPTNIHLQFENEIFAFSTVWEIILSNLLSKEEALIVKQNFRRVDSVAFV